MFGPIVQELGRSRGRRPGAAPAHAAPPARHGALRAARAAAGHGDGAAVQDTAGARPVRRHGRPRIPATRAPAHAVGGADARRRRAHIGMAGRPRRVAGGRRLHWPRISAASGATIETGRRVSSLADATAGPRRVLRRDAAPARCHRRRPHPVALPAADCRSTATAPAPSRWTGPSPSPVPWTNASGRKAGTLHLGGTIEEIAAGRARGRCRTQPGAALHAGWPAEPGGLLPRTRRASTRLWALLPRAGRLDRGHDRGDRSAARAVRSGLPRRHPGPERPSTGRPRGAQRELHRRRHRRRRHQRVCSSCCVPPSASTPTACPATNFWLCSASTPPGGGVHGMCGYARGPFGPTATAGRSTARLPRPRPTPARRRRRATRRWRRADRRCGAGRGGRA